MKIQGFYIGVTAMTLLFVATAQEPLSVGIQSGDADSVNITVAGGPGLHSLRKKEDVAALDSTAETGLTAKTNISATKKSEKAFFVAQSAPRE